MAVDSAAVHQQAEQAAVPQVAAVVAAGEAAEPDPTTLMEIVIMVVTMTATGLVFPRLSQIMCIRCTRT